MGWAIALAAAAMTPAAAGAQAPQAAEPQAVAAAPAPAATSVAPADAAAAPAAPAAPGIDHAAPSADYGVPVPGGTGIQHQVTEIGQQAANFHNNWLLTLCVIISLFVLALLVWTILRYRRGANPTPSRTSHNTMIEVVWTLVPVLILVAIAIPSIRLIRAQYSPPPADLTVKVIGNQWYWTYQYPDNGGFEIVSNLLKEQKDVKAGDRYRTDADGPPLLAVDERMVIPAGKVVKFIVTSNDVIHAFAMPAFWTKIDANPGRLNETWVKVDRPGVYFGQCSELCGARHGYMPIAIEVVPEATFNAWLASKGGQPRAAIEAKAKAEAAAAAAAAEAAKVAAAAPAEANEAAATTETPAANEAAPATN
ncbi:cytochrome c oxidase subunit II [Sphingomonas sp. NSE70-1]|uniref:Cytochrome c oxidase subunit 2 n=1 Tax=Sphingomonas caseinilyticus TaxID=2908205 RepID=A0ABT0RUN0_9SPHN|nr:cytochrome c oxidase subunit II [Sphingomonas caseinilyticus]MCL6698631.1 cytochrome c oxidase subunit II [Sphingomonas caseinilyticus]